ncbi:MAG TPA: hypothetical protein HA256_00245 [Methanoregulaceae archaeon]|jgi:hypothetical protein|nr:hypothetical protein [Methanoregulaceae archaeon]
MLPHRNTGRKPADGEQGLSEVIGFVLILGLIVIFITLWMTYVVPAEGRENEIQHMNDVRDWFTQYKITLDSLWINNGDDTLTGMTISNSLTLGSQGGATQAGGFYMPLMKPIGSTGGLAVVNKSDRISIKVNNEIIVPNLYLGALEFNASNYYWISQTFYYQMGGVFLRQEGGTVARVAPLVGLTNYNGTIDFDITLARIQESGLVSMSGQGPVRVDTRLDTASDSTLYTGSNVTVTLNLSDSNAAIAWETILKEIRSSRRVPTPSTNATHHCDIYRTGSNVTMYVRASPVRLTVFPANYTVSLQSIATGVT